MAGAALGVVGLTTRSDRRSGPGGQRHPDGHIRLGTGYCADVRVTTSSTTAVRWTVPVYVSGGTVNSVWNGVATPAGDHVDVSGLPGTPPSAPPPPRPSVTARAVARRPGPVLRRARRPLRPDGVGQSERQSQSDRHCVGVGLKLSYTVSPGRWRHRECDRHEQRPGDHRVDGGYPLGRDGVIRVVRVNKSTSGHVVVTNETWNRKLGQGASATFGMSVTGSIPAASTCTATTNRG